MCREKSKPFLPKISLSVNKNSDVHMIMMGIWNLGHLNIERWIVGKKKIIERWIVGTKNQFARKKLIGYYLRFV